VIATRQGLQEAQALLLAAANRDDSIPAEVLTHSFLYELARRCEEDFEFEQAVKLCFDTCALYYDQVRPLRHRRIHSPLR
jgi:hypothetical protein